MSKALLKLAFVALVVIAGAGPVVDAWQAAVELVTGALRMPVNAKTPAHVR